MTSTRYFSAPLRNFPVKWQVILNGRVSGTPTSVEDQVEVHGREWMGRFTEQSWWITRDLLSSVDKFPPVTVKPLLSLEQI